MGGQTNRRMPAGSGEGRHATCTEGSHTNLEVRFGINSLAQCHAKRRGMLNLHVCSLAHDSGADVCAGE